ncbi:MAG TPA: chromosomal replication initiator protein DnaA [Alphaproteobacteria bacterium]|nr:chromosomal replication initiator protein DnaA [Alphaproteobacteria bacterium]HAJ48336.1 chromosomal replication initiator protein DnaA [Alphaproteobacteria bacterium]
MDKMVSTDFGGPEEHISQEVWSQLRSMLQTELGEKKFQIWLQNLYVVSASDSEVELGCPTAFNRDYVNQNFGAVILRVLREINPGVRTVVFTFAPRPHLSIDNSAHVLPREAQAPVDASIAERLGPGSIPPNPSCTFRDFVVGKSNHIAYTAAMKAAEQVVAAQKPQFTPLFLYSGSGLGKTHLMNAVVWHVLRNSASARVLYITAESFMRRFITAMKERETLAFKDEMRNVDLLLVDDLQFIADKNATQEEFFYRFNELADQGKHVILSADRSPAQIDGVGDRIRARLLHGVTLEINATDIELRLAILERKIERFQAQYPGVVIGDDVRRFVAGRIASNIRELEGAIHKLMYIADTTQQPMTLDTARRELADVINHNERRLSVDEIKRTTANFYGIRIADMDGPRRTRTLVRPRQTAMYIAKSLTSRSYPEIGKRFGGRDHTTVMHAVRQVERHSAADPVYHEEVQSLIRLLKDGAPSQGNDPNGTSKT